MPNITPVINEAKRILHESPYDLGHDLSHHERVWGNAQKIAEHVDKKVDIDALQVATFWHDVTLGQKDQTEDRALHITETLEYLQKLMKDKDFSEDFTSKVVEAIQTHPFEKKQRLIEAKVLFDADKLDAFHKVRYTSLLDGVKNKQFSKLKIFLMVQAAKVWLKTVHKRFHFDVSREIYHEMISDLLKDKEAVKAAKELGIDIEN